MLSIDGRRWLFNREITTGAVLVFLECVMAAMRWRRAAMKSVKSPPKKKRGNSIKTSTPHHDNSRSASLPSHTHTHGHLFLFRSSLFAVALVTVCCCCCCCCCCCSTGPYRTRFRCCFGCWPSWATERPATPAEAAAVGGFSARRRSAAAAAAAERRLSGHPPPFFVIFFWFPFLSLFFVLFFYPRRSVARWLRRLGPNLLTSRCTALFFIFSKTKRNQDGCAEMEPSFDGGGL